MYEAACFREADAEDPVGPALPLIARVLSKQNTRFVADLEVVDAEVGGVGMRYVDGDERDLGFLEDVRDVGCYVLFDLKFEDEVNALTDELFGVADRDVRVVVFESAVDGFFLNHSDFESPLDDMTSMPAGPTGLRFGRALMARPGVRTLGAGVTVPG